MNPSIQTIFQNKPLSSPQLTLEAAIVDHASSKEDLVLEQRTYCKAYQIGLAVKQALQHLQDQLRLYQEQDTRFNFEARLWSAQEQKMQSFKMEFHNLTANTEQLTFVLKESNETLPSLRSYSLFILNNLKTTLNLFKDIKQELSSLHHLQSCNELRERLNNSHESFKTITEKMTSLPLLLSEHGGQLKDALIKLSESLPQSLQTGNTVHTRNYRSSETIDGALVPLLSDIQIKVTNMSARYDSTRSLFNPEVLNCFDTAEMRLHAIKQAIEVFRNLYLTTLQTIENLESLMQEQALTRQHQQILAKQQQNKLHFFQQNVQQQLQAKDALNKKISDYQKEIEHCVTITQKRYASFDELISQVKALLQHLGILTEKVDSLNSNELIQKIELDLIDPLSLIIEQLSALAALSDDFLIT